MSTVCTCGKTKDRRSIQCRKCKDAEPLSKVCKGCNTDFPIESYAFRSNGRGGVKRRSRCRICESNYTKAKRKESPEVYRQRKIEWIKNNPEKQKRHYIRRTFKKRGVNPSIGEKHYNEHCGLCDICGDTGTERYGLCIDHNHKTGHFRGLLCSNCNTAIGKLKDDINLMQKAIEYLQNPPGAKLIT